MIRNHNSGARLIPPEYHVTSALPRQREAGTLQRLLQFLAGKVGRKFGHLPWNLYLYELPACFTGDRVASRNTILDVEFDCLANVCKCILPGRPLRDTTGQGWNQRYILPIGLLFQDYGIAHLDSTIDLFTPLRKELAYSYRNATMGSIFVARRAGT
jgi:hypothetical protein